MPLPRARSARHWLTAGVLAALFASGRARADEPFELTWQAPPACPQRAAVREQIRTLVPRAMLERARLRAEGTIARLDKRFRLRLVMHLGEVTGERTIDSDSCGDLAGAAAVALGLLLQSASPAEAGAPAAPHADAPSPDGTSGAEPGAASEGPQEREGRREQPRESAPAAGSDRDSDDEPARARSFRVFLHAPQGSIDVGPLPRPSLALALGVGVSVRRWELIVGARLPTEQSVHFAHSLSAELEHFALSIEACRAFVTPPFELAPCLAFGLEHVVARGAGTVESARSADATWLSIGVEAWGRWYASDWFALAASVGGRLEAARPRVQIDGISDERRLRPAAFSLRAGPMLLF